VLKKLLAAVAIALTIGGATHLPDIDELVERVPPAVRAYTNGAGTR
jgi:hypothetical protein